MVFSGENARREILYEEMHPYGTSAYRSTPSATEVSARRYRYTGKERDEETGLDYFGARYYAPWLGRWTTADPLGLQAGLNLYLYGRASPVRFVDPSGTQEIDYLEGGSGAGPGADPEAAARTAEEQARLEAERARATQQEDLGEAIKDLQSAKAEAEQAEVSSIDPNATRPAPLTTIRMD
jgi:RHS repeat-associated protein